MNSGRHIYISAGVYDEAVVLRSGVSLYGGYSRPNGWARSFSYVTTINAVLPTGTRMSGLSGSNLTNTTTPTTVDFLTITTANTTLAGASNYGVYCNNCDTAVLRRLTVSAGTVRRTK